MVDSIIMVLTAFAVFILSLIALYSGSFIFAFGWTLGKYKALMAASKEAAKSLVGKEVEKEVKSSLDMESKRDDH